VRRLALLAAGLVFGAQLGGLFGMFFVRPSDGDLLRAGRELVPPGFTETRTMEEPNPFAPWDGVNLVVFAHSSTWKTIRGGAGHTPEGWRVIWRDPWLGDQSRMLVRGGISAGTTLGTADSPGEFYVTTSRRHPTRTVFVPAAMGAVLGVLVGWVVGALFESEFSAPRGTTPR